MLVVLCTVMASLHGPGAGANTTDELHGVLSGDTCTACEAVDCSCLGDSEDKACIQRCVPCVNCMQAYCELRSREAEGVPSAFEVYAPVCANYTKPPACEGCTGCHLCSDIYGMKPYDQCTLCTTCPYCSYLVATLPNAPNATRANEGAEAALTAYTSDCTTCSDCLDCTTEECFEICLSCIPCMQKDCTTPAAAYKDYCKQYAGEKCQACAGCLHCWTVGGIKRTSECAYCAPCQDCLALVCHATECDCDGSDDDDKDKACAASTICAGTRKPCMLYQFATLGPQISDAVEIRLPTPTGCEACTTCPLCHSFYSAKRDCGFCQHCVACRQQECIATPELAVCEAYKEVDCLACAGCEACMLYEQINRMGPECQRCQGCTVCSALACWSSTGLECNERCSGGALYGETFCMEGLCPSLQYCAYFQGTDFPKVMARVGAAATLYVSDKDVSCSMCLPECLRCIGSLTNPNPECDACIPCIPCVQQECAKDAPSFEHCALWKEAECGTCTACQRCFDDLGIKSDVGCEACTVCHMCIHKVCQTPEVAECQGIYCPLSEENVTCTRCRAVSHCLFNPERVVPSEECGAVPAVHLEECVGLCGECSVQYASKCHAVAGCAGCYNYGQCVMDRVCETQEAKDCVSRCPGCAQYLTCPESCHNCAERYYECFERPGMLQCDDDAAGMDVCRAVLKTVHNCSGSVVAIQNFTLTHTDCGHLNPRCILEDCVPVAAFFDTSPEGSTRNAAQCVWLGVLVLVALL